MTGEFLAFICLALVAIIGGVLLLNLTKVVQIIVALSFTFISIAGIYILLSAEFVAGVQVMIYSGAISIIMLFGIMLTQHNAESEETGHKLRKFLVFLGVLGFAFAVYLGIYNYDVPQVPSNLHVNNTLEIGKALYSKYTIPFELASVLLLVGLVGAIVLSKKDDKEGEN
ncbi:NADH-quinone oxidoreductase subunit J [Neobacillus sp. PS3-12]|uniref:NADH-quinone oxidoreductase subunit J n=1 Tax=Neobacillus sp. PS3-12 TaxID=3070677 RepID=UPI0027558D8D|nr:NADH-quinone oxidoreductase subunit J [Neobacillus sp. PS3-12]MDP4155638.1 NADH-quinone oxidoreductase subunit J [Bacillota bacterium]WML55250.1 NADH-quinone oxidoreductase subunit J [Neobacillus sp. PS3-12]